MSEKNKNTLDKVWNNVFEKYDEYEEKKIKRRENMSPEELELSKRKKIFMIGTFLVIMFLVIASRSLITTVSVGPDIESINISVTSNKVGIDKTRSIKVDILPKVSNNTNLTWRISNPNILEIDQNIIKGKELGKTTIYLTSGDVKSNEIDISCVTFINEAKIVNPIDKLSAFEEYVLDVEVFPSEAEDKTYIIESAEPNIIEIRENKVLYGKSEGETTILIKDTFGNILAEMEITVVWNKVTKLKLDENDIKIGKDQKYILDADIEPKNATNRNVKWETDNPGVASVDSNGIITAKNEGLARITVTIENEDKKDIAYVNVTKEKQSGKFVYSTGEFEIKYSPQHQAETIKDTNFWENIEILKENTNSWAKIRNSLGEPGYILITETRFVNEKPHLIETIKYVSIDEIQMPAGTEIATSLMALRYKGYDATENELYNSLNKGNKKTRVDENTITGGDPYKEFVGDPKEPQGNGNYGMFASPTVQTINKLLGDVSEDISDSSIETLFKHIDSKNPVILWNNTNGEAFKYGQTWKTSDGEYKELVDLTAMILVGYDDKNVYVHNPEKEEYQKIDRSVFFHNWNVTQNQAVVIKGQITNTNPNPNN